MKTRVLFVLISLLFGLVSGCASSDPHFVHIKSLKNYPKSKKIMARLTAYTAFEDKWGSRIAMSSKMRAKQGITVAAHPNFSFGTQISIPELKGILDNDDKFEIQDRGSAITKKTASRGQYYVFDIYLQAKNKRDSRRVIKDFTSKIEPITEVQILN